MAAERRAQIGVAAKIIPARALTSAYTPQYQLKPPSLLSLEIIHDNNPSTSNMATTTFHKYNDLPRELQILIWHHAAHPLGASAMLGDPFLIHVSNERFGHHEFYSPGFFQWISGAKFLVNERTASDRGEMAAARSVLREVCRLSRMVVLEVWGEEVRRIRCAGEFGWWRESVKREIVGLLDGLIEGL